MAHDTHFLNNLSGCNKYEYELFKNININYCVCLTKWHADEYIKLYPCLKDCTKIINNGINFIDSFIIFALVMCFT